MIKAFSISIFPLLARAGYITLTSLALISCSGRESKKSIDSVVVIQQQSIPEGTEQQNPAIPDISYKVIENSDWEKSRLIAYVDNMQITIGTQKSIFANELLGIFGIQAQEDFDGDGYQDALIYSMNPGSGGGSVWAFVTYNPDDSFKISNTFSEDNYYGYEVNSVNGQKVLDFVSEDLGKKVIRERHGLKNGRAVKLALPQVKQPSPSTLKTINMDNLGETGSFSFDLNDDGRAETITSEMTFHFGRNFKLLMNGANYEFSLAALWGSGKLHILNSKTNGMHDLMVETDGRTIYKWNGTAYEL